MQYTKIALAKDSGYVIQQVLDGGLSYLQELGVLL